MEKVYKIRNADQVEQFKEHTTLYTHALAKGTEKMEVSDGYHTMDELYEHRITLWIALCRLTSYISWRSKKHADGSEYEGWFVLGIGTEPGKQITYHLPMARWDDTAFAETRDAAPEFDGHTASDVLVRLNLL